MTAMTRKNLHAKVPGFFTALLGLQAFLTACGPATSGAETLTARPATVAATPAQNPLSDIENLSQITVQQLDAMQLPKGSWSDDIPLVRRVHSARESSYCPNFDIDGNGRIETIKDSASKLMRGDGAMIVTALMRRTVGLGWPTSLHNMQGDHATRLRYWGDNIGGLPYLGYLNCLLGSAYRGGGQGPNRLDVNGDGRDTTADAQIVFRAFSLDLRTVTYRLNTASRAQAIERMNDDLRICYAYFKFTTNNKTEVRVLQQNCGIAPKTTFRQLPDLVGEKTVHNASRATCRYKSGTTTHYTRQLYTNVNSKNCGDPANEE